MEHTFRTNPQRFLLDHIIDYVLLIAFFVLLVLFLIYLYFVPETPQGLVITPLFYILMGGGLFISFVTVYLIGIFNSHNTYITVNSNSGRYVDKYKQIEFSTDNINSVVERSRIPNLGEFLKTDLPDYSITDAISEAPRYVPKPKLKNAYDNALVKKFGYDVKELGQYWLELNTAQGSVNIPIDKFDKATRKQIIRVLSKTG